MLTISSYKDDVKLPYEYKVERLIWEEVGDFESQFICDEKEFFCHEVIQDEAFCFPVHCPERLPQPKFPSPNSTFSPQELVEVEACIEKANGLLLALVSDEDAHINERVLQLSLRRFKKLFVALNVSCGDKTERVSGYFLDAGKGFIIIEKSDTKNISIIPARRVVTIHFSKNRNNHPLKKELNYIHPCLRRNLTFHFSEVVTRSPFLINLFFGLDLSMFLESYIGYYCYVKTESDKHELEGTLKKVDERSILIIDYGKNQGIDFDTICLIELEK